MYKALLIEREGDSLRLKVLQPSDELKEGRVLLLDLPEAEEDRLYAKISEIDGDILTLRILSPERRRYFRVDDVMPIVARKINSNCLYRSRVFLGSGFTFSQEPPDASIHPKLWQMLYDINAKISMILERLELMEDRELVNAPLVKVNLSAVGARFQISERVSKGDLLEIKMLLPTFPTTGLVLYGKVVRVECVGNGRYEVAVDFSDAEESIREIILKYTIDKQRQHLKMVKQKQR